MAYAMIGGIIVATLLTLLFLPALYVAWYRIRTSEKGNNCYINGFVNSLSPFSHNF
jgi:hypothetical protein